jgi:hypothetical protein
MSGPVLTAIIALCAGLAPPAFAAGPSKPAPRCDTAVAVGHVKRVSGPRNGVTLTRTNGAVLRAPGPLTPICPGDRLRVREGAGAAVDVHGQGPVAIAGGRVWTAPRKSQGAIVDNVWALFVDTLAPDIARVGTQQRLRGAGDEPCRLPGIPAGVATVWRPALTGPLRVPCRAPADAVGPLTLTGPGPGGAIILAGRREGEEWLFDIADLPAGLWRLAPSGGDGPAMGAIILSDEAAPAGPGEGPSPYDAGERRALHALWLARENPDRDALTAWQMSADARLPGAEPDALRRLIVAAATAKR